MVVLNINKGAEMNSLEFVEKVKGGYSGLDNIQIGILYGMYIGAVALTNKPELDKDITDRLETAFHSCKEIAQSGGMN